MAELDAPYCFMVHVAGAISFELSMLQLKSHNAQQLAWA